MSENSKENIIRVWMIIWSYWPGPQGGAEKQCRLICRFLEREAVEPTVITARLSYNYKRKECDNGIVIKRLGILTPVFLKTKDFLVYTVERVVTWLGTVFSKGCDRKKYDFQPLVFWSSVPFLWFVRTFFILELLIYAYHNRREIDCFHVHETGWLGAAGVLVGKLLKKKVLCKAATSPPFPLLGWDVPFLPLMRRLQRSCNVAVLNQFAMEDLLASGFPEKRLTVIPNAVVSPEKHAIPGESYTVLYIGNFSQGTYIKGFDVLFDAWPRVMQKNPKLKLVMAGGGDNSVWKRKVDEQGNRASVVFAGFINDLEPYYLGAALFVLPSRVEGMSNALLEACSYGVPVVASDIPANKAVIGGSGAGILVEQGSSEALSQAILHCMADSSLRERMGMSGRKLITKKHSGEQVAAQIRSMYTRMVDCTEGDA